MMQDTAPSRFWKRVDLDGPGGCWVWTGRRDPQGYGRFDPTPDRRSILAHAFSWEMAGGTAPRGWSHALDHLCRVRHCVNPAHLEVVTRGENVRRGEPGRAVAAMNRAKTHCPQGHEYNEENTRFFGPRNYRECRACKREKARARRAAKRAVAC